MPAPCYKQDTFMGFIFPYIIPIVMSLSWLFAITHAIKSITHYRETGLEEVRWMFFLFFYCIVRLKHLVIFNGPPKLEPFGAVGARNYVRSSFSQWVLNFTHYALAYSLTNTFTDQRISYITDTQRPPHSTHYHYLPLRQHKATARLHTSYQKYGIICPLKSGR